MATLRERLLSHEARLLRVCRLTVMLKIRARIYSYLRALTHSFLARTRL